MRYFLAIISTLRPQRVPEMRAHLTVDGEEVPAVWMVGAGEAPDYRYAGAKHVLETGPLSQSRNVAMEAAFRLDRPCVQLSDDLTGIHEALDQPRDPDTGRRTRKQPIPLPTAIERMIDATIDHEAYLGGVSPTDNLFFAVNDDVSHHAFIIGDMSCMLPNPLRFRTDLPLKEDLEYSIQHLKAYKQVARLNTILPGFQHRENMGGAVQIRTAEREAAACRAIEALHPGCTKPNGSRPNEILLRWPPLDMSTVVSPLRKEARS